MRAKGKKERKYRVIGESFLSLLIINAPSKLHSYFGAGNCDARPFFLCARGEKLE